MGKDGKPRRRKARKASIMSIRRAILTEQGGGRTESLEEARKASIMSISWAILGWGKVGKPERRKARKASIMSISWAILSPNGVGERWEGPEGQHHEHQLGHPQSEQGKVGKPGRLAS